MRLAMVISLLLLAGCAADPFTRPPLPVLNNADPKLIRADFAASLPGQFTSDDTVVIEAPFGNKLAALGVLRVDRAAGTFELVGLNPIGVKFFDIAGDRTTATVRYAIPPLMQHEDLLLSMATDIRRMYFDLVPGDDFEVYIQPTFVRYSQHTPDGKLVYEFGDTPTVLLEKRIDGFFGTVWRVRYYLYGPSARAAFPAGIVMDNNQFHYRIVVKNRDWEVGP
jgi:hypothetical protein